MLSSCLLLHSLLAAVSVAPFGKADGAAVEQYTITNSHHLVCKVMTYGATITDVQTWDHSGKLDSIVLGFDTLAGYLQKEPFFGATIGRYGNRIAKGQFTVDGQPYKLALTDGPNSLHGGEKGFDKRIWKARIAGPNTVEMSRQSPDGEEGYPGNLAVTVSFTLSDDNRLRIDYSATTDKTTPINLTNHTYWNLAGGGSVKDELLLVRASRYTPVDATLIPTGAIDPVKGGPMDFTTPKRIGQDLAQVPNKPAGYDHNYVLDHPGDLARAAAIVADTKTGRRLTVYTDQPGIQVYTANFLDGTLKGHHGRIYQQYDAICLETQHFPDSPNEPSFPSTLLHPGETYQTSTIYAFSTK